MWNRAATGTHDEGVVIMVFEQVGHVELIEGVHEAGNHYACSANKHLKVRYHQVMSKG